MAGLYELLPLAIRIRDEEASGSPAADPILKRVVGTVEDETDEITALIAGMRELLSFDATTDLILALLAHFLGVTEYPFSEIEENSREYVKEVAYAHRVKGTLLSILREMKYRGLADGTYIHVLWKWEINAVDEYVPSEVDVPYNSAYKSARVVFVDDPYDEGAPEDGPLPSDGSTEGVFVENQVSYSQAKTYRESLNNVFPIHVLVPPPTKRSDFEDDAPEMTDEIAGYISAIFDDHYRIDSDDLQILTQCVSACQVSCQERCETLCEFTCETSCEQACQALCEADCQSTCQSFCQASCEESCQDSCQSFCQSECQTNCQSACELGCQQACQFGCQSSEESCQSYCELNCQTASEIGCEDQCQVACQSAAQEPCPDGGTPGGEGV